MKLNPFIWLTWRMYCGARFHDEKNELLKKMVCKCKSFLKKWPANSKAKARVGRGLGRLSGDSTIDCKFA